MTKRRTCRVSPSLLFPLRCWHLHGDRTWCVSCALVATTWPRGCHGDCIVDTPSARRAWRDWTRSLTIRWLMTSSTGIWPGDQSCLTLDRREGKSWSVFVLPRSGSRVLSVDRTHLGPEEEQRAWTWTWPPSWEWRLSRPAPPPAPWPPATHRGPKLGTKLPMESCGWGRTWPMMAGPTEAWLNRGFIAMATAAHSHLAGCAAGSAAPGGPQTDQRVHLHPPLPDQTAWQK